MSRTLILEHELGPERVVRKHTIGNGLTVLTLPDPTMPVVAYHTWFRVGSRHEKPGRTGMAHLFEHMMFKATKNHAEGEFDRLMEAVGGHTNAATWVDWTHYNQALPASRANLELACRLEADRMTNLVLDADQLESEREVVINERRYRVDDDPDGRMYEELYQRVFGPHPYGWPTIGWMADIEALTLEDCQSFYESYYAPNNAVVIVVGGFDSEHALELIEREYGDLRRQEIPSEPAPAAARLTSASRSTLTLAGVGTPRVIVGYGGPHISSEDLAPLDVAMETLTGGESSRMYRRLVDEGEVAIGVDGWASHFQFPGIVELYASARPGVEAGRLESLLLAEIARLTDEPPTARELTKATNQLESAIYRGSEQASAIAYRLGHYEITAGDFRQFGRATEAVRRVTADQVAAAAKDYLAPDRRATVTVLPEPS